MHLQVIRGKPSYQRQFENKRNEQIIELQTKRGRVIVNIRLCAIQGERKGKGLIIP